MFEITIERIVCAAHALRFPDGTQETLHGHNWHIVIAIQREELDEIGLVADFHVIEDQLDEVLAPYKNGNFNDHAPFRERLNPSAENIAFHLFRTLEERLDIEPAFLQRVTVSEAPGCRASYLSARTASAPTATNPAQ